MIVLLLLQHFGTLFSVLLQLHGLLYILCFIEREITIQWWATLL